MRTHVNMYLRDEGGELKVLEYKTNPWTFSARKLCFDSAHGTDIGGPPPHPHNPHRGIQATAGKPDSLQLLCQSRCASEWSTA